MQNFQENTNTNNTISKSHEVSADISDKEKQEKEETTKQSGVSTEKQIEQISKDIKVAEKETSRLSESIQGTKTELNALREKVGLPQIEEDPPSVSSGKEELEKLKAEQEALEKQKEKLINQQEKEQLIREEKSKILQEKFDEISKEFAELNPRDFESIFNSGKTSGGNNFESKSMGSLGPEIAQFLSKAHKEGNKLQLNMLEAFPEFSKKLDEYLTKEAMKRVEKKIEEKKEEEQEIEKSPEVLKNEISPDEIKPEANPIKEENIETPEA